MLPHFFTSLIPCIQVTGTVRGNDEDYFSVRKGLPVDSPWWTGTCRLDRQALNSQRSPAFVSAVLGLMARVNTPGRIFKNEI